MSCRAGRNPRTRYNDRSPRLQPGVVNPIIRFGPGARVEAPHGDDRPEQWRSDMPVRIGDEAPDFTAETTEGPVKFHEWIGDKWAILFSHPKDFTPVCTTELGYMAKIKPEFDKRGVKIIGLSVDPSESHVRWLDDIEETQGAKVNYPIIADHDLKVSKLYEMLPAEEPGTSEGRTPATNQTVRTVYVIGPDKKIKLLLAYP